MIATTSSHSRHRFSASNRAVEALPAIEGLLEEAGFRAISFQKAEDFLRDARFDGPCCIILDVSLPGISGLDFQQQLRKAASALPSSSSLRRGHSHDRDSTEIRSSRILHQAY